MSLFCSGQSNLPENKITGEQYFKKHIKVYVYLLLMSFNVQLEAGQNSTYLLEWINLQRATLDKNRGLLSFVQVLQEGSLYDILLEIDPIAFHDFGEVNAHKKMDMIEKYLDKEFGKRVKWSFKQSVGDFTHEKNMREFAKLVCFFSIYSEKKNDFVGRILTLSESSQRFLMEEMQLMEKKLENITEIKEIIEQIQYLESQNEELKLKLKEMTTVNMEMLEILKDTEAENKNLKTQVENFRKQKTQIFESLQIDYISEYLVAYNKIKKQNETYLDLIHENEKKLEHSSNLVDSLTERIKSDALVIGTLSDEITRLKQICKESRLSQSWFGPYQDSKKNLLKSSSSNKENLKRSSMQFGKQSLQAPTECFGYTEGDSFSIERSFVKAHNEGLMTKLEGMYSKYNELNNQTTELKQKNKKLLKNYAGIRKMLKQVQSAYKEFQFKYQASSNQQKRLLCRVTQISNKTA